MNIILLSPCCGKGYKDYLNLIKQHNITDKQIILLKTQKGRELAKKHNLNRSKIYYMIDGVIIEQHQIGSWITNIEKK